MNVIFLTMVRISDVEKRGIYHDLMRKFRNERHQVYIVTPCERRLGLPSSLTESNGVHILNVKTLNIQKTNIVEKGLGTLLLEGQYKRAIKKYLKGVKFDLITYSTPPITFTNVVKYLKKENPQAISYLQLKDIFPQNAVDISLMIKTGVKGIIYKFFRKKEKKLYSVSDYIGCMSPENCRYLLSHNSEIPKERVEVAPNSLELSESDTLKTISNEFETISSNELIRKQLGLPQDRPIFIYGGNLGKPQGIPFLIECLEANKQRNDCHFVVVGTGTELPKLQKWFKTNKNTSNLSVTVMQGLPKTEYDELVKACDVGLIFLDNRFTIPNYPSRLLSYLENKMPILCATDPNTDIGKIAEDNGYGMWCESNSVETFTTLIDKMIMADRKTMGEKGYQFLKDNYLVQNTYDTIMKHLLDVDNNK